MPWRAWDRLLHIVENRKLSASEQNGLFIAGMAAGGLWLGAQYVGMRDLRARVEMCNASCEGLAHTADMHHSRLGELSELVSTLQRQLAEMTEKLGSVDIMSKDAYAEGNVALQHDVSTQRHIGRIQQQLNEIQRELREHRRSVETAQGQTAADCEHLAGRMSMLEERATEAMASLASAKATLANHGARMDEWHADYEKTKADHRDQMYNLAQGRWAAVAPFVERAGKLSAELKSLQAKKSDGHRRGRGVRSASPVNRMQSRKAMP